MNKEKIKETFNRLVADGSQGFTLNPDGDEYDNKRGFAVSRLSCASLEVALQQAGKGEYIGWWEDQKTNRKYIEVVNIFYDFFQALAVGVGRREDAIYDFKRDCLIDITGFYGGGPRAYLETVNES